jgi:hypothetical protein
MRGVERALTDDPERIRDLAVEILGDNGRPQVESVRRAAKRLAEQGRARVARFLCRTEVEGHDALRSFLTVRRPVTDDDRRAAEWCIGRLETGATLEECFAACHPDDPRHASVFGDGADFERVFWLVHEWITEVQRVGDR